MNDFNLDDIEEVESRPKRRKRHMENHNHNHNHNHNNNHMDNNNNNLNYQNNNQHQHNHSRNHNHNHNHLRGNRVLFSKDFGFTGKLLMTIFLLSSFVLFFSFLINLILSIKGIITPRIFIPSIIIYILTFLFAGGILGTYVAPPLGNPNIIRKGEILMMRTFTPSIMLIITIIFLIFGLDNIKFLKKGIEKAQKMCESHKGLSMEEIYILYNQTNYELEQYNYKLKYILDKNLVCVPKGKCVNLINEENNYICNTDEFTNYNDISNVKCNKINLNDEIKNNMSKNEDSYLFFENCNEINKNNLATVDIFKCESKSNLKELNLVQNYNENEKQKIEAFFIHKLDNCSKEIENTKKLLINYNNSIYDYDLECYNSIDYKLSYLMINIYCIIYYFISGCWIFLGLSAMCLVLKYSKDNNILDNNINRAEIKDINNVDNDEDNNKLIIE